MQPYLFFGPISLPDYGELMKKLKRASWPKEKIRNSTTWQAAGYRGVWGSKILFKTKNPCTAIMEL